MSEAEEAWEALVAAFGYYGKRVNPRLRGARRKHLQRLLRDGFEPDELAAAVHGYVRWHEGLDRRDDFDPRKWFTPETVLRVDKLEMRIELGLDGPWEKPLSRDEQVRAKQEAARQRVAEARAAQERLRVVGDDEF